MREPATPQERFIAATIDKIAHLIIEGEAIDFELARSMHPDASLTPEQREFAEERIKEWAERIRLRQASTTGT
jgi:hypothetical protein